MGHKRARHGGGHHGGAWKVAYADFVTAMMAFFLLLWLLNAVSKEQLEGISDYFSPISKRTATSGGFGLLQGETVATKGVFDAPHGQEAPPAPRTAAESAAEQAETAAQAERAADITDHLGELVQNTLLAHSVSIDMTPAGIRIQIMDQDGLAMFPRGQSVLYKHARTLLSFIAEAIAAAPERIEIAGHTDAAPFSGDGRFSNWELSAERANAARRALVEDGIAEDRVTRVVGHAARQPLYPADPLAPGNRRLTITLLRAQSSP
jgi:chemotaxis protein MotB